MRAIKYAEIGAKIQRLLNYIKLLPLNSTSCDDVDVYDEGVSIWRMPKDVGKCYFRPKR